MRCCGMQVIFSQPILAASPIDIKIRTDNNSYEFQKFVILLSAVCLQKFTVHLRITSKMVVFKASPVKLYFTSMTPIFKLILATSLPCIFKIYPERIIAVVQDDLLGCGPQAQHFHFL